jgi:hypothetical protein
VTARKPLERHARAPGAPRIFLQGGEPANRRGSAAAVPQVRLTLAVKVRHPSQMSSSLDAGSGWIEADPRVLGALVVAVVTLAAAYVGGRLFRRRGQRRVAG